MKRQQVVRLMDGGYYSLAVNEFGNPVQRTKHEYPYTYDGFVTYRNGKNEDANCTVYSDRIHNGEKYDKLAKKHFGNTGQYFSQRSPESIEAFLRDFYDEPRLKLIFIMEYCNVSSGYPLWRFEFYYPHK